jgi:hypothetical protein
MVLLQYLAQSPQQQVVAVEKAVTLQQLHLEIMVVQAAEPARQLVLGQLVLEQQIKALQVELAVRFQVHPMVAAAAAEQEQLETHQHLLALVESVAQAWHQPLLDQQLLMLVADQVQLLALTIQSVALAAVAQVVQAVQVMLVQLEQQIVALAAEEFMADQQHRAQVVLELLYLNTQTLEQLLLAAD